MWRFLYKKHNLAKTNIFVSIISVIAGLLIPLGLGLLMMTSTYAFSTISDIIPQPFDIILLVIAALLIFGDIFIWVTVSNKNNEKKQRKLLEKLNQEQKAEEATGKPI